MELIWWPPNQWPAVCRLRCLVPKHHRHPVFYRAHQSLSFIVVTVINVCYQFSETVCSHVPKGAHLPFPSFSFKGTVLHSGAGGPYFHVDVTSVQLPPLDTQNQIWKASMGSSEMLCVVVWVGLCSTEQPSLNSKRWHTVSFFFCLLRTCVDSVIR